MSNDSLIDEVRSLTPMIRRDRGWAEEHVRIAPKVHQALGDLGIFRITAPHRVRRSRG